tara:strand:- start:503 stop:700 length:198 start_codon:yes stop_codon:yes gene_type:complete
MPKTSLTTKKKARYKKRLKEIEAELKNLQTQFSDLKKRAHGSKEKAIKADDSGKIDKIRKKLGLK